MENREQNLRIQPNWLLFFLSLLLIYRKDTNKLNFQEINLTDLDKKTKLLNRIKGYMDPQEQHVIYSAEIILQIIAKIKILMDLSRLKTSEVRYSTLGSEDKKRNMLMDLREFLEDEASGSVSADGAGEKTPEPKKLASILETVSDLKEKEKVNILDVMEIIQPFVDKDRKDSLMQMIQTFGIVNGIKDMDIAPADNSIKRGPAEDEIQ